VNYLPGGDGGHGSFGTPTQVGASGCGIPGNRANAIALGPDGNIYVGVQRNGNITRVVAPHSATVPCGNFQNIGQTPDTKRTLSLGFIGNDLYGLDGAAPFRIVNAVQCFTPANGNSTCGGEAVFPGAAVLARSIATDQAYPATNGHTLYVGDISSVSKADVSTGVVTTNWGVGLTFPSGITVDTRNSANPTVYVGDDPSQGASVGLGKMVQISEAATPAPPGAPQGVQATARSSGADVTWQASANGSQPVNRYIVHTILVSALDPINPPPAVNDLIVPIVPPATAPATSTTVTGLQNGSTYAFTVEASNGVPPNPVSDQSNSVTPQLAVAPTAPQGVHALGGTGGQASVAWSEPASTGGSPITQYTVTALLPGANPGDPGVASGITATAAGTATGTIVNGLNGTYTFTVRATNAVGDSPESTESAPVTVTGVPTVRDMAIAMSGPAQSPSGVNATYTMTVSNTGNVTVPQVIVTDTLPATGATFVSSSTTRGSCLRVGGNLTCALSSMTPGTSATINVTLTIVPPVTNSATVQGNDAGGNPLPEASLTNNTASVTTDPIPPPQTTTDIQVRGAASNAGPAAGSIINYTWQIKNGTQIANNVQFTNVLPSSLHLHRTGSQRSGRQCHLRVG
jgi:uncharacterized repeat protein (TIGR01451 family)